MQLDVFVVSPRKVIFKGKADNLILPGEQGVFEVLAFHKRIVSRLVEGTMVVGDQEFPIKRGIIRVSQNKVTIIAEEK